MAPASFPSGADDRADYRADGLVSPQVLAGKARNQEVRTQEVPASELAGEVRTKEVLSREFPAGEGPAGEAFVGEVDAGKIQPQRSKIRSSVTVSWDLLAMPWGLLKRGSRVAVIAPSGPVDQTLLDNGLLRLRSWGLVPVLGRSVSSVDGFTAGPDNKRAEDLLWALSDPLIEALCVARGGYGLRECGEGKANSWHERLHRAP